MSDKKHTLELLLNPSLLKILRLFINNEDQKYYLREVAKLTKIPAATTYRMLNQLVKAEILNLEQIKTMKLYTINQDNSFFLTEILQDRKSAVQDFVESISAFDNIEMVVLHGNEEKTKANVLVIGTDMDTESIKKNALYVSDKYKFNLIILTLTPDQYNQMSSMGLYPGKKRILFEKDQIKQIKF
ncbi:MAG: helix-turn-helix domain-containing protein [Candidatus Woesearchaeota archaeon]